MYLEKAAIDYLKGVNIAKIFKKYFISESSNKSVNIRGNSNEFLEHREYYYSDDLKNINWKLYAKTEKLYTKVFSSDISREVLILLDTSKSMLAGQSITKSEYSKYLVSIVAYKLAAEGYKILFATFADTINNILTFNIKNFHTFNSLLKDIRCNGKTNFSKVLRNIPGYMGAHSNLLIISDFVFISPAEISTLRKFFPKRDIVMFQVLSKEEISLVEENFAEFVDPEEGTKEVIQVGIIKKNYLHKLSAFLDTLYSSSSANRIPMLTFPTNVPYYVILRNI